MYGQTDDTDCDLQCTGNPEETCGAGARNEVFAATGYLGKI